MPASLHLDRIFLLHDLLTNRALFPRRLARICDLAYSEIDLIFDIVLIVVFGFGFGIPIFLLPPRYDDARLQQHSPQSLNGFEPRVHAHNQLLHPLRQLNADLAIHIEHLEAEIDDRFRDKTRQALTPKTTPTVLVPRELPQLAHDATCIDVVQVSSSFSAEIRVRDQGKPVAAWDLVHLAATVGMWVNFVSFGHDHAEAGEEGDDVDTLEVQGVEADDGFTEHDFERLEAELAVEHGVQHGLGCSVFCAEIVDISSA